MGSWTRKNYIIVAKGCLLNSPIHFLMKSWKGYGALTKRGKNNVAAWYVEDNFIECFERKFSDLSIKDSIPRAINRILGRASISSLLSKGR